VGGSNNNANNNDHANIIGAVKANKNNKNTTTKMLMVEIINPHFCYALIVAIAINCFIEVVQTFIE
jgi:hypothetical protein